MTLPVAILAGGLAVRLGDLTKKFPKSLLEVAGRPFAEHQLELLRRNGIRRAVFCVGYLGEMVREALGDGSRFGMEIGYSFDGEKLLGTGGALRKALPLLGEAFFVLYGDSYLDCDYMAAERAWRESGKAGLMTVFRNLDQWDRSNVLFRDGRIVRYDKRQPTADMHHIDYGLEVLRSSVFDPFPADEPIDLAVVLEHLVARDDLAGYEMTTRFYEIGSHAGLEETRDLLIRKVSVIES